eukprot:1110749-Rhodomonas_salina.1
MNILEAGVKEFVPMHFQEFPLLLEEGKEGLGTAVTDQSRFTYRSALTEGTAVTDQSLFTYRSALTEGKRKGELETEGGTREEGGNGERMEEEGAMREEEGRENVKRYSISSLLELRSKANAHVEVDAKCIEEMVVEAFARLASKGITEKEKVFKGISEKDKDFPRKPSLDSASARSSSPTEAHMSDEEHHEEEDGWTAVQKKVKHGKQPFNTRTSLATKAANCNRNRSSRISHGKQRGR